MANISKITLPDNSEYDIRDNSKQPLLTAGANITIDANNVISATGGGSGNENVFYGTCTTESNVRDKVVVCPEFTSEDLVQGTIIYILFSKADYGSASTQLTLNINNTGAENAYQGAYPLKYTESWTANEVVGFIYNTNGWVMIDGAYATDINYGVVKLLDSVTSTVNSGFAATPKAVKQAYDLAASKASTDVATTSINGLMSSSDKTKLDGIEAGAEVNVQSDWAQTDTTADDYIKNKPTIPTIGNVRAYFASSSSNPSSSSTPYAVTINGILYPAIVTVAFTYPCSFSSPYLSINGQSGVIVDGNGETLSPYEWKGGEVISFYVGGATSSRYVINGGKATTSYYGMTKLSSSINSISEALSATPYAVKQVYDLADSKQDAMTVLTEAEIDEICDISGEGTFVNVDDALSSTSENPVRNRVITTKFNDMATAGILETTHSNWNNGVDVLNIGSAYNGSIYKVSGTAGTEGTNYPVGLPTELQNKTMVSMRYQLAGKANSSASPHAVVLLYEVHPVAGRMWINAYNVSWRGWKRIDPLSYTVISTM